MVALGADIRVLIIKLADRLHNLRTLWALQPHRQKYNAKETLDILVPIAHRLGMYKIKSELEDLSLRYYKPDIYFGIVEALNKTKVERDAIVNDMLKSVSDLLKQNGIKHEIKGRAKSIYSIYKKMDKGKSFNDIYQFFSSTSKESGFGDVHIHLVIKNTERYLEFLILKHYLRNSYIEAKKYSDFKRKLVLSGIKDRKEYKKAKSEYVSKLLNCAKEYCDNND